MVGEVTIKNVIRRQKVAIGEIFNAPEHITFGYQEQRNEFSIWFNALGSAGKYCQYILIPSGQEFETYFHPANIVSTCIAPDGLHAIHLCRVLGQS